MESFEAHISPLLSSRVTFGCLGKATQPPAHAMWLFIIIFGKKLGNFKKKIFKKKNLKIREVVIHFSSKATKM
jgi:hypothetical protein